MTARIVVACDVPHCRGRIGIHEVRYEVGGARGGTGALLRGTFCSTHSRGLPVWRYLTPGTPEWDAAKPIWPSPAAAPDEPENDW